MNPPRTTDLPWVQSSASVAVLGPPVCEGNGDIAAFSVRMPRSLFSYSYGERIRSGAFLDFLTFRWHPVATMW